MPIMSIILTEPAWPDVAQLDARGMLVHVKDPIAVAGLSGGMASGKPSVALRLDLPNGTTVIAETSLVLFLATADALKAKFGDPRT